MDFPYWIKKRVIINSKFNEIQDAIEKLNLNTVCYSAKCPNRFECFSRAHLSFLILGNVCTRTCAFCGIKNSLPEKIDIDEPERISYAVSVLDIKYIVITSVTRDDLPDGGAEQFYKTVLAVRKTNPTTRIEVLIPDFRGKPKYLSHIIESNPDVIAYNIETVKSLYRRVRPNSSYERSMRVLSFLSKNSKKCIVKTSIMLGLGEKQEEVLSTIRQLRLTGCRVLVIGQYLKPDRNCLDVKRFIPLGEFKRYSEFAYKMGFKYVLSSPFARSSYLAQNALLKLRG
ncbi:MAG: lipoyl synthase [Candidatus Omnitrophica bacterium]|nr:lipoyl synthase [Candidatus Omnitrophota bacterium]